MTDWADDIAGRLQDDLDNSDQCEHHVALPYGLAPALRKAKADGMRMASELCGSDNYFPDHDRWFLEHRLFEQADKIEKGET